MPDFLPPGMGIEGMLSQIASMASSSSPSPSPSDSSIPPGFTDPGVGGGDTGAQVDWSWLTQFFQSTGHAGPRGGGRAGTMDRGGDADLGKLFGNLFGGTSNDQLVQAIMKKMGIGGGGTSGRGQTGMSYSKMQIAYRAAARAAHDASYRAELAGWLGWNLSNPQVQSWMANGGAIPSDPSAKKPIAATSPASGAQVPSGAQQAAAATKVSFPFPYSDFSNSDYHGNNYGDPLPRGAYWGGWQWHQGQDYGVAQNTPLSFPFAGTVSQVGYDPNGYGNYVTITFGDQGMTLTYAHLSYINVKQGDTVTPGQQVALSGGAGPGSGISTGSHLLVVEQNAAGQPIDPRPLLSAIYNNGNGTTLGALQNEGVGSTGVPITPGTNAQFEVTPDGKVLWDGTPERAYYDLVNSVYSKLYGVNAPSSIVASMRQAGVVNSSQMAAVAANWPSDIPNLTFGQRDNVYNLANGIAMKNYGRPIPDSLVKQLASQGMTSPDAIKEWFDTHLPTDMPAADYQQIYDTAMPSIQQAYGQGPSPEYIGYLWGKTQAPASQSTATVPTTTQTNQGGQAVQGTPTIPATVPAG